jgi:hypothetical protein
MYEQWDLEQVMIIGLVIDLGELVKVEQKRGWVGMWVGEKA